MHMVALGQLTALIPSVVPVVTGGIDQVPPDSVTNSASPLPSKTIQVVGEPQAIALGEIEPVTDVHVAVRDAALVVMSI
jgi:hypothetical protein